MATYVQETHRPATHPNASVVQCRALRKAFGRHVVLDGVNCDIPRNRVTVIMGPSGTGKSVLLSHIVGLLRPDSGDVVVNGYSVPRLNERELLALRRQVGMLFQDGALFSSMNLYDNVAFPLRQHTRKHEREIRQIVMARLEEVGLAGAEARMPNELSGGMRKRAGFARALVLEPKILLFDEPDSGLDPVRTALLCELIKEVQERHQCSAIIVSHDIKTCFDIADYVILLHGGLVVESGTKGELQQSPNAFTRQFLEGAAQGPLRMD